MKKPTNQKQAIICLLLEGWTNAVDAFKHAGTIKFSTRVSELSKDFQIEHRQVNSKSKFGHHVYFFEYRIKPGSPVQKSLIKHGLK